LLTFTKNSQNIDATEQVGLHVTLYACIHALLGSHLSRDTAYPVFRDFPKFFQKMPTAPRFGFIQNPSQYIIN
jgi:hypothetical protein